MNRRICIKFGETIKTTEILKAYLEQIGLLNQAMELLVFVTYIISQNLSMRLFLSRHDDRALFINIFILDGVWYTGTCFILSFIFISFH